MKSEPVFLQPKQCCLHVVDPQEKLMAHIHEADRVARNISLMINFAKVLQIPIIANTQYKKGIGPLLPEIDQFLEGVPCPDKITFNGLANTETQALLKNLPDTVDTLLFCGVESHICIYQSVIGALQKGYRVVVVTDAVSSRNPENNRIGQKRMSELGAVLMSAEMIVYEMLQKAGTPEFKAMLPFLK